MTTEQFQRAIPPGGDHAPTAESRHTAGQRRGVLREAGLRATPQRVAVLEALSEAAGEHLSADDVWQHLSSTWSMDRSTAYRVLADLTDAGLLTQVRLGDGVARFEMQSRAHHHALCIHCGATDDVPVALVEPLRTALARTLGFTVAIEEPLVVRGACRACSSEVITT